MSLTPPAPFLLTRSPPVPAPLSLTTLADEAATEVNTSLASTGSALAAVSESTGHDHEGSGGGAGDRSHRRSRFRMPRKSRRHSTGSSQLLVFADAPEGLSRHSQHEREETPGTEADSSLDTSAMAVSGPSHDAAGTTAGDAGLPEPQQSSRTEGSHASRSRKLADPVSQMEKLAFKIDQLRLHVERSVGAVVFADLYDHLRELDVSSDDDDDDDVVATDAEAHSNTAVLNASASEHGAAGAVPATPVSVASGSASWQRAPVPMLARSSSFGDLPSTARGQGLIRSPRSSFTGPSPSAGSSGSALLSAALDSSKPIRRRSSSLVHLAGPETIARIQLLLGYEDQLAALHHRILEAVIATGAAQ